MDDPETPAPENSPTEPPPLIPLRRPVARKRPSSEEETLGGDDPAGFIAFLGDLYAQAKGGGAGVEPTAPGPVSERPQSVLQAKRLPRTRGGVGGGAGGEAATTESIARSETSVPNAPVLGVMKPRATRAPRRKPWGQVVAWLAAVCLVLGIGVLAWRWLETRPAPDHRAGGGPPSSAGEVRPVTGVSDAALLMAEQALGAIGKGDLARASEILTEARNQQIVLPGLLYQSALLAYQQGQIEKADTLLDASIDANEAVPECEYLHAAEAAAGGDYKGAAGKMAAAASFATFSPRYYFYWAECLRRQGKPAEAVHRFEQALQRRPSTSDTELINFKLNLAKIEAGTEVGFQAALAEKLGAQNVSASLLLLGAANEINRFNYAAATPYLQRAAQAMPPQVFELRMRDYLFRLPDNEKARAAEWGALVPRPAPPSDPLILKAKTLLIDPATRSLAESDPAIW